MVSGLETGVRIFLANVDGPLFVLAMVLGGLANGLAFLVLARMHSLGYQVGIWRTPHNDFALYREYRRIAASKNWSKIPILLSCASAVLGAGLMFVSVRNLPHTLK